MTSHFLSPHLARASPQLCVPLARYFSQFPLCISQIQLCPSPPGTLRGICLPCQSWEWIISKFCVSCGLGICLSRGQPRAFNTEMVSYHGGFYWRLAHPSTTRKTCRGFQRHVFSILFMHFSIAYRDRTYTAKEEAIDIREPTYCPPSPRYPNYCFCYEASEPNFKADVKVLRQTK